MKGMRYELIVWVIMGQRGYFQNAGVLVSIPVDMTGPENLLLCQIRLGLSWSNSMQKFGTIYWTVFELFALIPFVPRFLLPALPYRWHNHNQSKAIWNCICDSRGMMHALFNRCLSTAQEGGSMWTHFPCPCPMVLQSSARSMPPVRLGRMSTKRQQFLNRARVPGGLSYWYVAEITARNLFWHILHLFILHYQVSSNMLYYEVSWIKLRMGCDQVTRIISQIPQCIRHICHNPPFCSRNVRACAFLLQNGAFGVWDWFIAGFLPQIYMK